jgi:hypothetical protein
MALVGVLVVAVAVSGCAGLRGPSAEELVMQQTKAFSADLLAGNADKLLGYVSESFTNDRVADKATLAKHIQQAKDKGKLEEYKQLIKDHEGKIDLTASKVKIDKQGLASVYPIDVSADIGSVTAELQFKKDADKVWRITGLNLEGI